MEKVYLTSCVRFKQLPSDFSSAQGCTASPILVAKVQNIFVTTKLFT